VAKERCKTCNQKITKPDPRTLAEAEARMEEMGHVIVQLKPWMMKFFEFNQRADGSTIYRTKPSMIKAAERKARKKEEKDARRKQTPGA